LGLEYEYSRHISIEGGFTFAPQVDYRATPSDIPPATDPGDTFRTTLHLDALWHVTPWEVFDPYAKVGVGYINYADDFPALDNDILELRAGVGASYHFTDEWAARADIHATYDHRGQGYELLPSVGVTWTWGARVTPDYRARGGEPDADGDGLSDAYERELGLDPEDPDTDDDGLTDGEEVLQYLTNPLVPDTDLDLINDGDEVFKHKTNPTIADTDTGGVSDGHEVIEDSTNPLNPGDDLALYTLNIEFDTNRAKIRDGYEHMLDAVFKVLKRDPGATARIEGHADRRKTSSRKYNQELSERRAQAVLEALVERGIERHRLAAVGFGFDRPVAPNNSPENMQRNRRTEVYVRKSGQ
jgi:outer membrane protein OmpA-like peptidoglycan-associated protein